MGGTIDVVATVTNTGSMTADEVVQLYTRDPAATITRPVKELQSFERVTLEPGRSARVTFELPVDALGFSGTSLDYGVEPGRIDVFVGTSSNDVTDAGHLVIAGEHAAERRRALTEHVVVEHIDPDDTPS